jgi:hypothetical protein
MWADAEHIDIREDGAYYKYTGTSYRDVFKNGLALEKTMCPLIADYPKQCVFELIESETIQPLYNNTYDEYTNMEYMCKLKSRVCKPKSNMKIYKKKARCAKRVEKCVFEEDDVQTFDRLEEEYKEEKWNLKFDTLVKEVMEEYEYHKYRVYDKYDFDDSYM